MFQGVASLKQETDQEEEYLNYDINGDCNNLPAYVFKTLSFYLTWHAGWTDTQGIIYPLSGYFLTAHTKGVKALKL